MGMFYGHNQPVSTPPITFTYGRLYNWFTASDVSFAPTDWKVAENSDFTTLVSYLGGYTITGGKLKETGFSHWNSPNTGATNSSGFTFLGAGLRYNTGSFGTLKTHGYLWTKNAYNSSNGWYGYSRYDTQTFLHNTVTYVQKQYGMAIRLVYTGVGTPTSVTDYDGNVYDVVQIGTQYWTKQNWKCTHLNDGTDIPEVTDNTTWAGLTSGAWCYYDNDSSYL